MWQHLRLTWAAGVHMPPAEKTSPFKLVSEIRALGTVFYHVH